MKSGGWFGLATVVGAAGWLGWGTASMDGLVAALPGAAPLDLGTTHPPSLAAGVAIGLSMSALRGVPWLALPRRVIGWVLDLPRRAMRWLMFNERNIYRAGAAAVCLAILIFY
jgi:hypothetical protein